MVSKVKNIEGYSLTSLMGVVAVLVVILAVAAPLLIAHRRSECDKAAAWDAAKFAAAMELFGQELIDVNC